ncbi:3'(2'),5'-bisphosphate nucleotidase CysQ [Desulfoferrobacter suflitae]|uniref:3'(2'),5'-bisphosphate nucleotidase CysQ n=1 Tax=Desulfoferrobacter suflitae TaxID=2865782 RepID=UPI0021648BF6|nr:3'(2'),5'-bisphosphate nucleotidase CysQ [Desulfoferrobacter suflitae]MCK8602363.1 3'(2'),5'-bisphosphate nucleotidase CysQ [Desulfoferrobacter suflitae]
MKELEFLVNLARQAGRAILQVYETEFSVERKEDRSPLTEADTRSHRIISRALQERYPQIPVLSEEGKEVDYSIRGAWSRLWLVDPLDGTKEFIKRNGEFTVNIALVERDKPVWGVIHIPVKDTCYAADVTRGAWRVRNGEWRPVTVKSPPHGGIRVVKSRSHPSPQLDEVLQLLPEYRVITRGSALKFCAVATGEADFYPRFGPTWEWDTAAGQAIVTAAGGVVVDFVGVPLAYNKADLINGPFLVGPDLQWLEHNGILAKTAALKLR